MCRIQLSRESEDLCGLRPGKGEQRWTSTSANGESNDKDFLILELTVSCLASFRSSRFSHPPLLAERLRVVRVVLPPELLSSKTVGSPGHQNRAKPIKIHLHLHRPTKLRAPSGSLPINQACLKGVPSYRCCTTWVVIPTSAPSAFSSETAFVLSS